ncbi:DNA primase [Peptostreptococcus canis]|uniref:DNA primase n=1 Tax=Peptostreptococcus canis TaxID=1159213 RepID=A0ABR6TK16_9FIRM|nr:DNA primase [Peptostreptococcus canis]MBC2575760.1 DNA primase [Peptostreptococcus canis]MBP1998125.1 DNA primase [Peptostreptococcus canis]
MNDLKDIIEEIKSRNDIADVISNYIQLKPSGSNYKGLCPFHGEKTPSFHVNTSKQIFKCFGCGEGGDVVSFIMKIENLDFMDSVKFLAEKSGVEINKKIDQKTKLKLEKIKKLQEINVEAARFFYYCLVEMNGNPGISYLRKRGLDEKTIKNFGLGYAPDSWDSLKNYMIKKGYKIEDLVECGLINHKKEKNIFYDKYRNRVIFPIFDYKSNIIGFGGRVLDDSLPKYLNSPESDVFNKRLNLYGLNFSRKFIGNKRELILVEGYMDLISLYQFGIKNVVATLGTALTESQADLIKKFADSIVISYDSDSAGINAALRAIHILENSGIKVRVLDLGEYKDPDEFIRSKGLSEMLNIIENSSDSIKFKIDILFKNYNKNDRKDIMLFLKEAVKIVRRIKSPIELNYYIDYLASITNTNQEIIKNEIFGNNLTSAKTIYRNKFNGKKSNIKTEKNINEHDEMTTKIIKQIEDGEINIERNLIKAMLLSDTAREIIPLKVEIDHLSDENSKKIYSEVLTTENKGIINTNELNNLGIDLNYMAKLDSVNLSNINLDNLGEIEKITNKFLKSRISGNLEELSKKLKILENRYKTMDKTNPEAEEVNKEIMKITLEIVEENKKIKSL